MTALQKTFIRNVRKERKRAGFTQEKMAEEAGIAHKYYNGIELGYRLPSFETIENIAKALRISAYRLFLDADTGKEMPQTTLIDRYNELLEGLQRDHLSDAKTIFFKKEKRNKSST
jgi:transcriptional regulator with XRE-family HTH domain